MLPNEYVVVTATFRALMSGTTTISIEEPEYFNNDVLPTWICRTNSLEFTKEIWMVYGQNTTVVRYHVKNYNEQSKNI